MRALALASLLGFTLLASPALANPESPPAAAPAPAPAAPLVIGTGAVTGIYFPAAGAVQRLVSDTNAGQVNLAVASTAGSIANLRDLATGKLDLAIAQSDWAYYAFGGNQEQFPTANNNLRSLFALHSELLTILVRADSGITSIDGLKGKKLNLGPAGSGTRSLMDTLFKALAWSVSDIGSLTDLAPTAQSAALCNREIDAAIYIVPHPNAVIEAALAACPTQLLPVTGAAVASLLASNPFYAKTTIPAGLYTQNKADVTTFGVRATLISTTKLSDDAAYTITKTVFSNLDQLKALHPALAKLDKTTMLTNTLGVPLHAGAEKYFKEVGLIGAPATAAKEEAKPTLPAPKAN